MTSRQLAVLVSLTLAFGSAAAAERGVPVVVTNGTSDAVPVLVTNPQGGTPSPKTTLTDVFAGTTATAMPAVGDGKSFLVKHLDVFMSNNNGGPLVDGNCVLYLHRGSKSSAVAVYALQPANLVSSMSLSQGEYLVMGPTDSLELTCVSNPSNSSGRVTVSGDVLTP